MSFVRKLSVLHRITGGKYKGRICNVRDYFYAGMSLTRVAQVVFADYDMNDFVTVRVEHLEETEKPGWEDSFEYLEPCKLLEYFKKSNLSHVIRDVHVSQPRAIQAGDVLATGEVVLENPRRGYNSSVLINLDKSGWVELAPRLPIALKCNTNFSLPAQLKQNDMLATGCLLIKNAGQNEEKWTNIFLDQKYCRIEVPVCIPLALT
jgi:hypothetical protein